MKGNGRGDFRQDGARQRTFTWVARDELRRLEKDEKWNFKDCTTSGIKRNWEEEGDDSSEEGESEEGELLENSEAESSMFGSDKENERSTGDTVVEEALYNVDDHEDFQGEAVKDRGLQFEKPNDKPDSNDDEVSNYKYVENKKVFSPIAEQVQDVLGVQVEKEETQTSDGPHLLNGVSERLQTLLSRDTPIKDKLTKDKEVELLPQECDSSATCKEKGGIRNMKFEQRITRSQTRKIPINYSRAASANSGCDSSENSGLSVNVSRTA
ncbi:hypothetical protein L2E82_49825 [Cichorium intybus]|uniref:Uncharacterized protein n=1 Tax=Cichorium intybus TaxID=13427 RepID=A0ACB8Z5I3_CICIN|nr:hypothetical protein L2E82_49825 [Cichorium intybus]